MPANNFCKGTRIDLDDIAPTSGLWARRQGNVAALKMIRRGLLAHAGPADQRLSLLHVDDLVTAVVSGYQPRRSACIKPMRSMMALPAVIAGALAKQSATKNSK